MTLNFTHDDAKFYIERHSILYWMTLNFILNDVEFYIDVIFYFFYSCNKNFDKPFWVPSAGKKCLTMKSTGFAVDKNDNIVSLHKYEAYI
jgi:hypothetical protein